MKEQKPLGPAQNKNNERNIKICKRNKIKAKYKLAREQKPFGPAKIENKLKYMQTTNEYATRNKILFGPALLKEKETKAYANYKQIRNAEQNKNQFHIEREPVKVKRNKGTCKQQIVTRNKTKAKIIS